MDTRLEGILNKFDDHTILGGAVKSLEGREASTNESNHKPNEVQQGKSAAFWDKASLVVWTDLEMRCMEREGGAWGSWSVAS